MTVCIVQNLTEKNTSIIQNLPYIWAEMSKAPNKMKNVANDLKPT